MNMKALLPVNILLNFLRTKEKQGAAACRLSKKFFLQYPVIFLARPRSARRARAVLRSPSGNSGKGALP
ncbi:MAG: hypothetical protein ACI4QW_03445, partial [Clostridia bacterium]